MLKNIIKKLFGGTGPRPSANGFFLNVRCADCGETFKLFVNTTTDLFQDFDEDGNAIYRLNKEIIGSNCRNLIQVTMEFDGAKNLKSKKIDRGEFMDES
jgi:hypothetical protein